MALLEKNSSGDGWVTCLLKDLNGLLLLFSKDFSLYQGLQSPVQVGCLFPSLFNLMQHMPLPRPLLSLTSRSTTPSSLTKVLPCFILPQSSSICLECLSSSSQTLLCIKITWGQSKTQHPGHTLSNYSIFSRNGTPASIILKSHKNKNSLDFPEMGSWHQ